LFFVALAVTFSALIPHFLYNKCPRCKKQLGRNEGDFCQFCGQKISD
jgi:rRNA maturation endonuclease Nob1